MKHLKTMSLITIALLSGTTLFAKPLSMVSQGASDWQAMMASPPFWWVPANEVVDQCGHLLVKKSNPRCTYSKCSSPSPACECTVHHRTPAYDLCVLEQQEK